MQKLNGAIIGSAQRGAADVQTKLQPGYGGLLASKNKISNYVHTFTNFVF